MAQASTTLTRGQSCLRHSAVRWVSGVFLAASLTLPTAAHTHHDDARARRQFAKAERVREALNGFPASKRTRHEYQQAINAYREVYFGSPTSAKADPSVVATAELMVEMGRRFDDNKILRGAVEEYRFLRREYPGSKYRFEALFTIGEIYKDDLNDPQAARTAFEDFLRRYPRNRLAEDARAALKEINEAADTRARRERPKPGSSTKETSAGGNGPSRTASSSASGTSSEPPAAARPDANEDASIDAGQRGELPRVTGVRHWSTPNYTRVAIDVEREVKFESQRIADPDRIIFNLRDTRLASTLVGKSFDVDDGFLKQIRVAEIKPGRTRIVLEVDDLSSYDAFLLPDPYRLIIDIHARQSRNATTAKSRNANPSATTATEDSYDAGASPATVNPREAAETNSLSWEQEEQRQFEKDRGNVAQADRTEVGAGDRDDRAGENAKALSPSERNSQPTKPGVVKTTVPVKGSDRRIPKTIVEAEDDTATRSTGTHGKKQAAASVQTGAGASAADASADNNKTTDQVDGNSSAGLTTSPSTRRGKPRGTQVAQDSADLSGREARPTAAGDRSLTRALGLKIGKIVIDAGHGGHDTGTIGPNGLMEKEVVLDVARRLGRLLEARLGAEVIYTRRDDTFVPLETRTAIANRAQADLFISIHANSSRDPDARGVETYYLNFTSSPDALEVAARENAVSEKSIHELQDLVRKIALKDKIDESREFAADVQDSLYGSLELNGAGVHNRGIKKAPFIVLIGANMPSILAEISFVSNPVDERRLETSEQRQRIAEALYRGVARYANGLSGVKVASKIEKPEGQ